MVLTKSRSVQKLRIRNMRERNGDFVKEDTAVWYKYFGGMFSGKVEGEPEMNYEKELTTIVAEISRKFFDCKNVKNGNAS